MRLSHGAELRGSSVCTTIRQKETITCLEFVSLVQGSDGGLRQSLAVGYSSGRIRFFTEVHAQWLVLHHSSAHTHTHTHTHTHGRTGAS